MDGKAPKEGQSSQEVGDYDLRIPYIEKALYRQITDDLINADENVWNGEGYHGFPCWDMYRCAISRDFTTYAELRVWMVAFAFAYAESGGLRADAWDDAFITYAAWDALHFLINKRWILTVRDVAPDSGKTRTVYGRFRKALAAHVLASLDHYLNELQYQLGKVIRLNKGANLYSRGTITVGRETVWRPAVLAGAIDDDALRHQWADGQNNFWNRAKPSH